MCIYKNILSSRGLILESNYPLWKLKITDEEYGNLKNELLTHKNELWKYGKEAALYYAEWWRRDYTGDIPSKESVATSLGLSATYADLLFKAAYKALSALKYTFIRSQKGTEYFRTLLNQGGLPINYIKAHEGGFNNFSRFLRGLIRELSIINYDWQDKDISIIRQFNCISYLAPSFKNDNIYDVSIQIAHAIIMHDPESLPYDNTDTDLKDLTTSLSKEYTQAKSERHVRPLSLHWRLRTTDNGHGFLYVKMDEVKDISSGSIPELNCSTCDSFDIFVAGYCIGKYHRTTVNKEEDGKIINATYTRSSTGGNNEIPWNGESVVEVKVRCNNDDRIFLTVAGCYPPNFDYPQVFQELDDNYYCKNETSNTKNNIAIFDSQWDCDNRKSISIGEQELYYGTYSDSINIRNNKTDNSISLTNEFTPYTAAYMGTYISWIEKSNYKLLTKEPRVFIYDKDKNRVNNCTVKYKTRNSNTWHNLNSACVFPMGLIDIRAEFPDKHSDTETFYAINDLSFGSQNEEMYSTEIFCTCNPTTRIEIENIENADIQSITNNKWKISKHRDSSICPSLCSFRLYNEGNPVLRLSVAIPFKGARITDINNNVVSNDEIISLANIGYYNIISHGVNERTIDITYTSDNNERRDTTHIQRKVINGLVSLADYRDIVTRIFNQYGDNSFDRSSSVKFSVFGNSIFIRKFVLDSTIEKGNISILSSSTKDPDNFIYKGDLHAFPVGENVSPENFETIELTRLDDNKNVFSFPENFSFREVVVFSGVGSPRRIIPKYYNREERDFDRKERHSHQEENINKYWYETLGSEKIMGGKHWQIICKSFYFCSKNDLPFKTYNGLTAVAKDPKLIAKFVVAMFLNNFTNNLSQDIDRFEQEMDVSLHWVSAETWRECLGECLKEIPQDLLSIIREELIQLLKELFLYTLSTDIANDFTVYIVNGELEEGHRFTTEEINDYKSKIHGISDLNKDLPRSDFQLQGNYAPNLETSQRPEQKAMIKSAMCAAENTCNKENRTNLFECKEQARTANFYRTYFKETYCDIFFRTVKLLNKRN
jgi:hypothetical protein